VSSLALAPPSRELVLGRYRPVRPLGSGGSGSVWLARDERTGLEVALKIVPREGKAAARAEREALAARRLRHERCVRAYDVGHDASHVYIAYEHVPGRTVREALRANALSDADVVELAAQALEALAHAHRLGIVHRDVKPSNLLLEDGEGIAVRLLDFGLAQFDGADTLTATGDVPGTLAYISPERLAGADATPESDVWSVGVLLWEALAGEHPFWGVPLQEVAKAIAAGAPPLAQARPDLPRRLLAAVDAALALDPAARPRASELAHELRAASKAAPGRLAPEPGHAGAAPGARLLRTRALPAALAALATGLGATVLPFWPAPLVAALVAGAAAGAWRDPRLGLSLALAAPLFPFGNLAAGAAVLYAAFALVWLALCWREPRTGLLFLAGPLLAPAGLLALVPLAVQPVRSAFRRAAQAASAVLAAALAAGLAGEPLPLADAPAAPLRLTPLDSAPEIARALWGALAAQPLLLAGAALAATVAAVLPGLRRWRFGVAAGGAVCFAGSAAAGSGPAALAVLALAWAVAAGIAAGTGR
jgi:hypothetical protein